MKQILTLSIAGILLLSLPLSSEAQIWKRLKNKAKEAAEKKLEEKASEAIQQKAEQMVEDSWNEIFGALPQDSSSGGRLPFTMNSNVKTEDTYQFNIVTTMELESVQKNGQKDPPGTMLMYFNKDKNYTGTRFINEEMDKKSEDLVIIYDFDNSAMLMLMSSDKDNFSFAYDWKNTLSTTPDSVDTSAEDINWDDLDEWQGYSRIGTKKIAGYSCDGYLSQTDEYKTEVWVTRDEDYGMENMFKANANAKQLKENLPDNYPYGMLMEMTSEDLKTGEKTIMRVTNIQKNATVKYTMADYPTMSLALKKNKK